MADIRELLEQASDVPTGLPDVDRAWRRAQQVRRRRTVVRSALVAAVLVLVAGTGLVVDSRRDDPPPVTEPAPALQLPAVPGPLAAGTRYDVGPLGLPFALTIPGPGWRLAARQEGWLSLHHGRTRVNLQRWSAVYSPDADPVTRGARQPVPADLADWVRAHPRLEVAGEQPVELAGAEWVRLDLAVADPLTTSPDECGGRSCVLLATAGTEPVDLLVSETAALYVRPSTTDPLVLLVARPASRPGDPPEIRELVASLTEG